jgi:hypothetical protein
MVIEWLEWEAQQSGYHVRHHDNLVFGDLVGSPGDPLAAELFFLPETVLGLTAQGYDSITAVLFFKQPWCPLIVGCMLWSVVPVKPVHTTSAKVK